MLFYLLVLLSLSQSVGGVEDQPNIIVIVADDFGWNDVGYHGSSEMQTPNLNRLAGSGVKLENYYVQPVCSPSRSQLLSGRYQIHTGLQHSYIHPFQPNGLPLELPTMADKMKEAGYATHMIGKWHIGFYKKQYTPTQRGFDSYFGYLSGSEDYYTHSFCASDESTSRHCGVDLRNNEEPVFNNTEYSTHLFTKKAQDIIRNHDQDAPLFLYLPFQSVHTPLQVPKVYEDKFSTIKDKSRRIYAGMVFCLDEGIGNITSTLVETGLYENTIIVFSTDNGGQVHAGGNNYPLRGNKATLWEGGIHGVGFVHSPLLPNPGDTSHSLIHISDWYPTLVNLAKGNLNGTKLDGYDVWQSIIRNAPSPRKELLHNIDPLTKPSGKSLYPDIYDTRVRSAIRAGDWKLITGYPGSDFGDNGWYPQPDGDTVHVNGESIHIEQSLEPTQNIWLFNITADPTEHHDLSKDHPGVVVNLLHRLAFYNSTAVKVVFPPDDPRSFPELHGGAWSPWE